MTEMPMRPSFPIVVASTSSASVISTTREIIPLTGKYTWLISRPAVYSTWCDSSGSDVAAAEQAVTFLSRKGGEQTIGQNVSRHRGEYNATFRMRRAASVRQR